MMLRTLLVILFFVIPIGVYAQEPLALESRFNADEVSWVQEPGTATLHGSAYLKLADGSYLGCGDFHVELLPSAAYADERIYLTYGNNSEGQILMAENPPKFIPDAEQYHELNLSAECDDKHRFVFHDVPAGKYYLIAFIIWPEGEALAGGGVMQKVSIAEGQIQSTKLKL
ncbi:hypothetical protein QWI17_16820 [Gilvimarinus sp. SDUM040013]|uniref:Uncharacterized protein n=1 Tax=Gilvimarinus gilvus TaxID=3058038 RepID=A0ABU4S2N4_9GAMM|nr:hypothetical protein [Gilvimarinus sp. SDUM040013]MDO3387507.1 hypothetical protein [Gilvimarinus sp. SDUM040013]MDX6851347.1 hypothetical protein [Gilvimarinus sp. SDUM040013]